MAAIGKCEIELAWKNEEAKAAFTRIVSRIRQAREMSDTVKPSEVWDDLQLACEGITVQVPQKGVVK